MSKILRNSLFILSIVSMGTAFSQGPKAPEAGGFEPIDATDMVNLLTGDFTYVLPLMNVPSPEGGYPLALAYHAGIAYDQEASWTGLGWNLNPGAINRSINGFPDDYDAVDIKEHFYDEGGSASFHTLGIGYSYDGFSVGAQFSWGTNKAFGGSVSLGYLYETGFGNIGVSGTIGESNSIGIGYSPGDGSSGLTFGVGLYEGGEVSGSAGYVDSNGSGISVSASTSGTTGISATVAGKKGSAVDVGFSFSDSGIGINGSYSSRMAKTKAHKAYTASSGVGINIGFASASQNGDYVHQDTGPKRVFVFVPTPYGNFSFSMSNQRVKWALNKTNNNVVFGALNLDPENENSTYFVTCEDYTETITRRYDNNTVVSQNHVSGSPNQINGLTFYEVLTMQGRTLTNSIIGNSYLIDSNNDGVPDLEVYDEVDYYTECTYEDDDIFVESMMDITEFSYNKTNITNLDENNAILPTLDNFNVSAQGIAGNMNVKRFENGALYGATKNFEGFENEFTVNGDNFANNNTDEFLFTDQAYFYLNDEFSSYLGTSPAVFFNGANPNHIVDLHNSNNPNPLPRRKVSGFIEYFTYDEIHNPNNSEYINKYNRGYIKPSSSSEISAQNEDGIEAFTVVAANGKRFHYSIPVLNKVISTRRYGSIADNGVPKPENESYFERLQDVPYATHWLLTAVTGPDYIDLNNNNKVDDGDYGYWVEFDYGKWSEAFPWKSPYGEDHIVSLNDDDVKTVVRGFKDVYYLDKVTTRTHTALFAKSLRFDNEAPEWEYKSVYWGGLQNSNDYENLSWFTLNSQMSLKLGEILLFKNEDLTNFSKASGDIPGVNQFPESVKFPSDNISRIYYVNREAHVVDFTDIEETLRAKAIKIVDFKYASSETSLAQNSPNTSNPDQGRLTLDAVEFQGKGGAFALPSYKFQYHNEASFDVEMKNDWGYYKDQPWMWSLKEIQTPEGAKIQVTYESDDFDKPAINNGRMFTRFLEFTFINVPVFSTDSPGNAPVSEIEIRVDFDLEDPLIGNEVMRFRDYFDINEPVYMDLFYMAFINYKRNNCPPINGYNWSRSHIDIVDKFATIEEIVDVGDYIGQVNGVDVYSTESYMMIKVDANSPLGYGNPIIGHNVSWFESEGSFNICGSTDYFTENQRVSRYDELFFESESNTHHNVRYSLQFQMLANKERKEIKDGDLRVKSLTTTDDNNSYTSNYYYNNPAFDSDPNSLNYRSSGTVSYIPGDENYQVPYASQLPAPKVMYEYVTVEGRDEQNHSTGSSQYKFYTLPKKDPIEIKFGDAYEIEVTETNYAHTGQDRDIEIGEVVIHDNLSAVGQLIERSSYNKYGQLLSKSKNEYFSRLEHPNNQGVEQQSYQTYKEVDYIDRLDRSDKWIVNSTTIRNYAQALKSSSTTSGGYAQSIYYDKYDDVTGSNTETTLLDSYGRVLKSIVTPAFRISEYGSNGIYSMGSKVDDLTNRNMLTQIAAEYSFWDDSGTLKPLGVGINTWYKNWEYKNVSGITAEPSDPSHKIWRKHQDYIWDGEINEDGSYNNFDVVTSDSFDWTPGPNTVQPVKWKKVSQVNVYDEYSMPLEVEDVNGNWASTKMTDDGSKVLLVTNAAYGEGFYTGAEYDNAPGNDHLEQLVVGKSLRTNERAHTGSYSVKISPGGNSIGNSFGTLLRGGEHRAGEYKLSVWVYRQNAGNARFKVGYQGNPVEFNGETAVAGEWKQMNHYFTRTEAEAANTSAIVITSASGDIYLDDFRLHPVESSMTSYVYNDWDELSFILGNNNLGTQYIYDDAGRLIEIYREVIDTHTLEGGFKLSNQYEYNYKRSEEANNSGNTGDDYLPITGSINAYFLECGGTPPPPFNTPIDDLMKGITGHVNVAGGTGSYTYEWELSIDGGEFLSHGNSLPDMLFTYNPDEATICDEITGLITVIVRCRVKDADTSSGVANKTLTSSAFTISCVTCDGSGGGE